MCISILKLLAGILNGASKSESDTLLLQEAMCRGAGGNGLLLDLLDHPGQPSEEQREPNIWQFP